MTPELSIVAPIFNEVDNIQTLYDQLKGVLIQLDTTYEIILIDDGSNDGTTELLRAIADRDRSVRVLVFRRNFGQTSALMAGFDYSSGATIVTIDGDGQNDPSDIPRLLDRLRAGYDVVSGLRRNRKDGYFRVLLSAIANRIISRLSGVRLRDYGCTLKAYRRLVLADVRLYGEMHRFIPIFISWEGGRVSELEVNHRPRRFGRSKYGVGRTFKVLLDLLLISFLERAASKPIHVFGGFGLICLMVAAVASVYAVWLKFGEGISFILTPLPLMIALFVLVGIISILGGLLAEMITRTYYESQDKRPYSIAEVINDPSEL